MRLFLPLPHFPVLLFQGVQIQVHPVCVCRCQGEVLWVGCICSGTDFGDVVMRGTAV